MGNKKNKVIKGKALIVWDKKVKNKKRDFIDTDQITPAEYCVSESLENIDKLWKIGAFKHLIPNFQAQLQNGANFLIVGDYFGIGSSREMSPVGLKNIAQDLGTELIIVCGESIGEIFRKNSLNIGLYVFQSRQAVEDAQENDVFKFNPTSNTLTNITQKKHYKSKPFNKKEKQIFKLGGIVNIGKKELTNSINTPPNLVWPDPELSDHMTLTEQILWAHRVNKQDKLKYGDTLAVYTDLLPASDGTAPLAIYTFNKIIEGYTICPRQVAIINDHFVFTGKVSDQKQMVISKDFAKQHNINKPYYAEAGDGIFHFYLPEKGLIIPSGLYAGADSHSRAYGAYSALGIGVGSSTLGFGWANGYIYLSAPKQRQVKFTGNLKPWVSGKDIVLALLKKWGNEKAQGMSVEFIDSSKQLDIAARNTISNMMAEAEAYNGIFVADEITIDWYKHRNISLEYPILKPGINSKYSIYEEFNLSNINSVVAKPFSPDNVVDVEDIDKEKITFCKAMIGSCTNGSYEDLLQAAIVIMECNKLGINKIAKGIQFLIFPGSLLVRQQIELLDHRLNGNSIANTFRKIGGKIRESWCGPCFGQGPDKLQLGERAITSFNRNWQNRMGKGGEGYLASPATVAASALAGYITSPCKLLSCN